MLHRKKQNLNPSQKVYKSKKQNVKSFTESL